MALVWSETTLPKKREQTYKSDYHKVLVAANEDQMITEPPLFAVLDGHGGRKIAIEAKRLLRNKLKKKNWKKRSETEEAAMRRIFMEIDKELYSTIRKKVKRGEEPLEWDSGSTCTAVKLSENGRELLCATIGDSQLLSFEYDHNGKNHINTYVSPDHAATSPTEQIRVVKNGGSVYNGRVGGTLAIARSFGDFDLEKSNNPFKKNCGDKYPANMIVSADPDIHRLPLAGNNDEPVWWILASDGLWDIVHPEYIAEILDEIRRDHGNLDWKEKADLLLALLPHATESRSKWIHKRRGGGIKIPKVYDATNAPHSNDYPHDDRSIIVFITNINV